MPDNGGNPALIGRNAASSKTVFVKLLPLPPRRLASVTRVPSGLTSVSVRSPVKVCVRLTRTLTPATTWPTGTFVTLIRDCVKSLFVPVPPDPLDGIGRLTCDGFRAPAS